jgi:hypothetical protein
VCKIENEFVERSPLPDDTPLLPSGYSNAPGPFYESGGGGGGGGGGGYFHSRGGHSTSTDGSSTRSTSGNSHTSHDTRDSGRLLHDMRSDHLFYDSATDTWTSSNSHGGHSGGHYGGPHSYDKNNNVNHGGNKSHHGGNRNVKRPSHSNIFNLNTAVAAETMTTRVPSKEGGGGGHRKGGGK